MFPSPLTQEAPFTLTVDPYWILVSLVQFLILYWLLRRFLWVPVTKALETRAAKIREGLELAEAARRERGRLDARQLHDQALAQLRGELASMVVLAASRLLGREISAEQHRALIEQSLNEAGAELKRT